MNLHAEIAGSTALTLQRAILIYSGTQNSNGHRATHTIATMHGIETGADGIPQIQAGACVTREAVETLARDLLLIQQDGRMELLPEHLLASGVDGLMWHTRPGKRQLWWKPQALHRSKEDTAETREAAILSDLSGEMFPQPHLLFLSGRGGLRVYALKGEAKPTARTPIFHAPYWNISAGGSLCIGDAAIPQRLGAGQTAKAEKGFFQSNFTHNNCHGAKLTLFPGGHTALWKSLKGRKNFPDETLARMKDGKRSVTLGDLLGS